MTYIAQEQSIESGSPLELYEITLGTQVWRYTSGDANYSDIVTGAIYKAAPIIRPNLIYSTDIAKTTLEIQFERTMDFLELFRVTSPSEIVSLIIKRVQRNDTSHEVIVIWSGRILNILWEGAIAKGNCESIRSSSQRFGLRRCFQLQCPHVLYSAACGASKALHEVSGTVTGISADVIIVPESSGGAGTFTGGYAEWTSVTTSATERRMITNDDGSGNLTLAGIAVGLSIGSPIRIYPGCDHTIDTCELKFSNSLNYGGFPYTPSKNPFGNNPVF